MTLKRKQQQQKTVENLWSEFAQTQWIIWIKHWVCVCFCRTTYYFATNVKNTNKLPRHKFEFAMSVRLVQLNWRIVEKIGWYAMTQYK